MAYDVVRVLEHVHGHLGWLTSAALLHPAILLRRTNRKAHLSVALATGFVTVTGGLGLWIYEPYRVRIKQSIFLEARWVGFLFERKEHLAFGAIVLAWAGATAYTLALEKPDTLRQPLRTFAHRAFVASCSLALLAAALGTAVASFKSL
jgi:hypothetical protein